MRSLNRFKKALVEALNNNGDDSWRVRIFQELTSEEIEQCLSDAFDEYVPASGAAETVMGEIVRALMRMTYRWYNDGDKLRTSYGNETVNPAYRYLTDMAYTYTMKRLCNIIADETKVNNAVYSYSNQDYEKFLNDLIVAGLCDAVTLNLDKKKNNVDMLDYITSEDLEWYKDDEDDEWIDEQENDY